MTDEPKVDHLKANEPSAQPVKPSCRARRVTLASALKQARKAGVNVKRADIEPDGRVSLTFGNPNDPVTENEWDRVLHRDKN